MASSITPRRLSGRTTRILFLSISVLTVVFVVGVLVARHFWPYAESSVRSRLAADASADVRFGSFHEEYFPPGCVAENVTFQRANALQPLISIRRLTIRSNLVGIFRATVSLVRAEGMHVVLGRSDFAESKSSGQQTTVDNLVADDAILEIRQGKGNQPLRFVFHKFRMQNLGGSGATKFAAEFNNPLPAGFIRTSGQFGPWNSSDPAATAVLGKYSLENADLGVFPSIAGILSSTGDFSGTFKRMDIEGSTISPEFEVTFTHHKQPLQTHFVAEVNAVNGETVLRRVKATFGRDEIEAHGRIGRELDKASDKKRAAILDLSCERGRIEDTFYPFIHSAESPLTGNVVFQMHVVIPSGEERFLKRLQLNSDFRIEDARFTNPETESRLSKISKKPEQKQPDERTPASMSGKVTVVNGVAHFTELMVRDQDASAQFRGNYSLTDERVNMHGNLKTKVSLANTTSGLKAVFAKALEPLFKKKHNEKVVPVRISGTYHHPSFGLDLNSNM